MSTTQEEKQPQKNDTMDEKNSEIKAVVLTNFGGLKSLKVMNKPYPEIKPGNVIIKVMACGLNFQDLMVRQGAIDTPPKTPFIMGSECAGEIIDIGEDIKNFKVGDRVVALPEYGAWSEIVCVSANYIFKIPDNMSFNDAAGLALNYIVAYILLFELGGLSAGKSILLHSAGGGVGQAIVQLSRTVSEVVIFGVASSNKYKILEGTVDVLLERGVDYISEIRKISSEGVDIVLDCLCGEDSNKGYSLLKPMGKYVLYGTSNVVTGETKSIFSAARSWWQVDKLSPIKLFDENKTVSGFNLRRLLYQQHGSAYVWKIFENVLDLWKKNKINLTLDSKWAFEDVPDAMQKLHDRKNIGKVILDPALEPKVVVETENKGKKDSEDKTDQEDEKTNSNEKDSNEKTEN